MIIYDCEIIKGIAQDPLEREPDIEYCDGWRDFENMGISCIGAYDYATQKTRLFLNDALCHANFGIGKTGHGALAPNQWQRRQYGRVIDYRLGDIGLTKRLLDLVSKYGLVTNPKDPDQFIPVSWSN